MTKAKDHCQQDFNDVIVVRHNSGSSWDEVEDRLAVLLRNNVRLLRLFQDTHKAGVQQASVLASLACLVSSPSEQEDDGDDSYYWACSLETVADVLTLPNSPWAIPCVRLLWKAREGDNCVNDDDDDDNHYVQCILQFLLGGDGYFPQGMLWWELRAQCLQLLRTAGQQRRARIRNGAEQVEYWLWAGARTVETGISLSTRFVTDHVLEPAGGLLCEYMEPQFPEQQAHTAETKLQAQKELETRRSQVVTRTYADAARRATESTRVAAQRAIAGIRDVSKQGISTVAQKVPTEQWVQNEDGRVLLEAVGSVGMAGVGAMTIVGEAVVESTKKVAKTTANVTAQVVQHKYGPSAGQTARDVTDTAGNILRTVAYVGMFKGKTLTRIVAKDTGKAHLVSQIERF